MKIKSKISVFFFLLSFFVATFIKAQTTDRLPCINKTFSIVVHIVKDSTNGYGLFSPMSLVAIQDSILRRIDSLNAQFAPICVSFQICEYQYINNYLYLDLSSRW